MREPNIKTFRNYCLHCGFCFPYCKRLTENKGASECKKCLLCYKVCPRLHSLLKDEIIDDLFFGNPNRILRVRTTKKQKNVQNSGMVTLMIKHLLTNNFIEAALVTKRKKDWKPVPFWAKSPHEVEEASGSKYSLSPTLSRVKEGLSKFSRMAIVGLPCQIKALYNMHERMKSFTTKEPVIFCIGLFCMNSFIYDEMRKIIESEIKIHIEDVDKIEIKKGKVGIYSSSFKEPAIKDIKILERAIWPVCRPCSDFTAVFSDISVGSIGTKDNENTIIVRSQRGNRVVEELIEKGLIQAYELRDLSPIKRIMDINKKRGEKLDVDEREYFTKKTVLGNMLNLMNKIESV